ncbi:MAG TPA: PAAR-like domain-containing protein [Pirellulales bacterium]|jgi:hypothetical protein|nr:PAAR-like domain-containing protein [Pirellulales bacterium]
MGANVFANGDEIACKAGNCQVIAAFPDVCLTPPPPPAGPIPVPYPDTSFSKDMQNGTKTVQIGSAEVMMKNISFYGTSPLGDEPATMGQGAGVITHKITGYTYFTAWSMDVIFEGANVDRHTDMTTSNHMSPQPGNQTMMANIGMMAITVPGGGIPPPPGDCQPGEYSQLNQDVQDSKAEVAAAGGACRDGDDQATLEAKGSAWLKQAVARARRDMKCFRGGDDGHQQAQASAWEHVGRCQRMSR